jgi:hypothetical protein
MGARSLGDSERRVEGGGVTGSVSEPMV